MARKLGFELSVSGRDDGTLEAAYIHLSRRKVARTVEILPDVLMADYDSSGELIGVEILAPVRLSRLTRLVDDAQRRRRFKHFVEKTAPNELVRS